MTIPLTPVQILASIERCRFRFNDEKELQAGIALALDMAGITYQREKVLSPEDRPDFLVAGHIALEIKIKGSVAQALRQINRYTAHPEISTVLLVGTPGWLSRIPAAMGGKPVFSLRLTGSLL